MQLPVVNPQSPKPENKDNEPEQAILDKLAEEFNVSPEEKDQFSKIMNSVRNMELTVSVGGGNSSGKRDLKKSQSISSRPPVPPKAAANTTTQKVERSPRFVRKADSYRATAKDQASTVDWSQ